MFVFLLFIARVSAANTYYVDVDGIGGPSSDSNPGTIDQPFKTIEKARDAIRALGTAGHTVYVRGGTYRLASPLTFTSSDSGSTGSPNVYRNYPGEQPVISGGQELAGTWVVHSGSIWKLEGVTAEFRSLWVDGARATRAREPDEDPTTDYNDYFISEVSPSSTIALAFTEGDIDSAWTNLTSVEIQFLREFQSPRNPIASVDDVDNVVWFSKAVGASSQAFYVGNRYWVENVFEGLDSPGEWYLNTVTNILYYYPVGGKNPNDSEIVAGNLGYSGGRLAATLLHCSNLDYAEFWGITFSHGDWYITSNGWSGAEAEITEMDGGPDYWGSGPAVFLRDGSVGCRFVDCVFSHIGAHAFYIYGYDHSISHCQFLDIGASAVHVSSETDTAGYEATYNITIADNTIRDYGVVFPAGKGIVVERAHNIAAMHNSISNGGYMGIQMGDGGATSLQYNNTVSYNEVWNVCNLLPDAAGVYGAGTQTGSVFSHNKVHDITSVHSAIYDDDGAYGKGLYLDEDCDNVTLENNWVYRVPWGLLLHLTENNAVRNNVFAGITAYTFVYFSGSDDQVTANIFYNTASSLVYGLYKSPVGPLDYDLCYNTNSGYTSSSQGLTWAQEMTAIQGQGFEINAVQSDPLFVDYANDDLDLRSGSPALLAQGSGGIGFEQITGMDTVGPRAVSHTILALVGAGGSVSPSGETSVAEGGSQTVTFTPETGYSVSDVLVDGVSIGAMSSYTFSGVSDDHSIRVAFSEGVYVLEVAAANGSVTRSPDADNYAYNQSVSLTATPADGYSFVNWTGDLTGSSNPASIVMDDNKSVTANFVADVDMYGLTISASGGSVSRSPDQASYASGTEVTLQATANAGYTFAGWSGDASGTSASVTITMSGNKSVTANFAANTYSLAVVGTNGSVAVVPQKATYSYGETVSVQAVPSTGYHFTTWSGDLSGSSNPASLVMNGNKSVTAGFAVNTYTLSATAVNGSVAKSPDQANYNYGTTVSLQAVAGDGYEFIGWSGAVTGSANPTPLVMNGNKSVTASFALASTDEDAPVLLNVSPAADAIQTPLNSLVSLHIADAGEGVDANTVTIAVNGESVYSGNVASYASDSGVCRRVGTQADYTYAYQATSDLDYDETVTVTVNAVDLAGNAMTEQSYSFRTQMRAFGTNRCASWGPEGADKGDPATVSDASGNLWVAYHAGAGGARDIYVSERVSGSEQFGEPIQLTDHVLDQCNPDIATGTDGRSYVVWQDNRRGNWDIYVRVSTNGISWSAPVRVASSDYDEVKPAIAVDSQSPNRAYVTWEDNRSGNQDVYVSVSSDGFVTKTAQAVTSDTRDQTDPQIAVNASNTVYIVWTDGRNESSDVYGAASNSGPWSNVAVVTGAGNQFSPVIAAEPTGDGLHFAWVSDLAGNEDIWYGSSDGLPASPLAGVNIIDDSSGADQEAPAIAVADGADAARIFVCWQDARNVANILDTDIYAAEIRDGDEANLLVGDGGTGTNQSEPAMAVDLDGRPYIVWTDDRNAADEVYFAASTFVEPTPLDEQLISSAVGGTVGVASPVSEDDVSVVIPAGACPYDVTVSVARIQDLQPGSSVSVLPYEFGPSGLQFDAPVTITMPYLIADYSSNPPEPYWYDTLTGTLTQQGITNIEYVALSATVGALRFQTTHFTAYTLVAAESDDAVVPVVSGGGGGGGCSLSPVAGARGAAEFFLPYALLAAVMIKLRIRDARRHRR